MRLWRFQKLSILSLIKYRRRTPITFGYNSRSVHRLVLCHTHLYLPYRASTIPFICSWTFEHRIISHIMIPWLKYRLLTRRCDIKVRLAHLLETIPSGSIHAHFIAIKTYDASSLIHHMRLGGLRIIPVIRILLMREIQGHLLLIVHTHAVIMDQLLVFNISLQVFDTIPAPHNAILIKSRCRLLVHGSLSIVDYVTWRGQNWTFVI